MTRCRAAAVTTGVLAMASFLIFALDRQASNRWTAAAANTAAAGGDRPRPPS